jgi:hypothetical protein
VAAAVRERSLGLDTILLCRMGSLRLSPTVTTLS